MPNEADGRIKFFDQSTDLEKSKVPELYSLMSNINGIDKWHKYMANPKPVSPFECVYDWVDEYRGRIFAENSKFTAVDIKKLKHIQYTITPLKRNPYLHNSVRFTFTGGKFRMERWASINPMAREWAILEDGIENPNALSPDERIEMLQFHAVGIFDYIIKAQLAT